jgi:hypothetical protein
VQGSRLVCFLGQFNSLNSYSNIISYSLEKTAIRLGEGLSIMKAYHNKTANMSVAVKYFGTDRALGARAQSIGLKKGSNGLFHYIFSPLIYRL